MIRKTVDHKTIVLVLTLGLFLFGVTNICNADAFFDKDGSTATRSVDENAAVGTNVGAAFSLKSLCFDPIRFKFPNHTGKFEYVVSTDDEIYYSIQIKTKVSLDYETQSSYSVNLIIEYYDYLWGRWMEDDRVTVTINVNDVAEGEATDVPSEAASTADALPTLTSEKRERIISLLTLENVIFNELFNATNDSHDWVELRNVTIVDVDLSGWHLIVITSEMTEVYEFPTGTVVPVGDVFLFLNTDPNTLGMPLASDKASYHYHVDERFILPQEDFMMLLKSPSAWEDNAGSYLFGLKKSPMTMDFTSDTVWYRTKSTVHGHHANAWIPSGYQNGLGYDKNAPKTISLGTPGYPHEILVGDANVDGIVNILDLVFVVSQAGMSDEPTADINGDGMVNMRDLYVIASKFGDIAAAPSAETLTAAQVEQWLKLAKHHVSTRPIHTSLPERAFSYERGIQMLEDMLRVLRPQSTALLANYPNPFNPETWIPYQLSKASDVKVTIYDSRGSLVRQFNLGHQPVGSYQSRNRALYWDGTNALGESVASGVYFYSLRTDDFSATRKMLILK